MSGLEPSPTKDGKPGGDDGTYGLARTEIEREHPITEVHRLGSQWPPKGAALEGGKVEGSSYRMVVVSASKQMGKGNQHYATIWDVSENFSVFILQDSECRFPAVWVELFGIFSSVSLGLTVFGLYGLFSQVWGEVSRHTIMGSSSASCCARLLEVKEDWYGLVSYDSRKTRGERQAKNGEELEVRGWSPSFVYSMRESG